MIREIGQEKIIKTHLDRIDEVEIMGAHRPVFRIGGPGSLEFKSLREALQAHIFELRHDLTNCAERSGEFSFRRKRGGIEGDVKQILQEAKGAVEARLRDFLLVQDGDFSTAMISSIASHVEECERRAYEDLKTRLVKAVSGSDLQLLFLNTLFPDVLKTVIGELPGGQDPEDVLKENIGVEEESKKQIQRAIDVAVEYFKKVPKELWE